jgi:hypothetical protein
MARRPSAPGRRVGALVSWVLVLAACASPIHTSHDSDPEADFGRYRSWAWISEQPLIEPTPGVGNTYVSPLDDKRIRRAVESQLAGKGYRSTTLDEADLVVSFTIGSEQKVKVSDTPGMSTVYTRGYGYGSWYGTSPVSVRTYTEGTLALQFFERESQSAVWVGWASKRLSQQDESEEVLDRAVSMILEPFPSRGQPVAAP